METLLNWTFNKNYPEDTIIIIRNSWFDYIAKVKASEIIKGDTSYGPMKVLGYMEDLDKGTVTVKLFMH